MLEKKEVSAARWLTVDEICKMDGTFEGDREFFQKVLPLLEREKAATAELEPEAHRV